MSVIQGGIYYYDPPPATSPNQTPLTVTSGSEQSGDRPWVVVSRDSINKAHPNTAVVVPLSTNLSKANSYRIQIPDAELISDDPNTPFVSSVALCDHVRIMDVNLIRRKAGRVSDNALRSIGLGLAFVLDIR